MIHRITEMGEGCNFGFTNFPFKKKYNNTIVYSVNSNYLYSREKQTKKIVETILSLNLLCLY